MRSNPDYFRQGASNYRNFLLTISLSFADQEVKKTWRDKLRLIRY